MNKHTPPHTLNVLGTGSLDWTNEVLNLSNASKSFWASIFRTRFKIKPRKFSHFIKLSSFVLTWHSCTKFNTRMVHNLRKHNLSSPDTRNFNTLLLQQTKGLRMKTKQKRSSFRNVQWKCSTDFFSKSRTSTAYRRFVNTNGLLANSRKIISFMTPPEMKKF